MARAEDGRPFGLAGAGRDGRVAAERAGSLWRPRRHLRLRCRRPRGHRKRGAGSHDRRLRAQRHRRALHPELRLRGAEAALAAEDGERRVRRRHRDDRTRHRLRPAGRADHGAQAGQQLRHQRPEDLHHQRPGRRPDHRGGAHRRTRRQGHLADRARDRGQRGLPARPQPRQDRPARVRHVRTVLRQCGRAAGEPARHRGRQRLRPVDAAIAAGAPFARRRRRGLDGARGQADGRLHQGTHRRSASRSSNSRTPRSSWPSARPRP